MKIVSGGQTGADRGALEAAMELGTDYGGWVPKGRLSEDGGVPAVFDKLREHPSPNYQPRTYCNVRDSDATVIFADLPLRGGSKLTARYCRELGKPFVVIPSSLVTNNVEEALKRVRRWAFGLDSIPSVLNVAGRRESKAPSLQVCVKYVILNLIKEIGRAKCPQPKI